MSSFPDPIKELKKFGIHYQKYNEKTETYVFKCDKHPYQEETIPAQTRQELFNKLGNLISYNADTEKLLIGKSKTPKPEVEV